MGMIDFNQPVRLARGVVVMAALAMGAFALSPMTAQAQDANKPAAPQAAAPQAPAGNDDVKNNAWIKLCNKDEKLGKDICVVTQELRDGNSGGLLASVTVRQIEGEKPGMIIAVPVGLLLRPGIQLRIDKSEPKKGEYTVCFPNACVAGVDIDADYIGQMKKGGELLVAVIQPDTKPVAFPLTLSGFTKAYDGPPTDPKLFEEGQKNLAAEIEKRAKEAREKAAQAQQGQSGQAPAKPKAE